MKDKSKRFGVSDESLLANSVVAVVSCFGALALLFVNPIYSVAPAVSAIIFLRRAWLLRRRF
jgi:hypothetical protein